MSAKCEAFRIEFEGGGRCSPETRELAWVELEDEVDE